MHPASPRYITLEQAVTLAEHAQNCINKVAVVVNPQKHELDDIILKLKPEYVQFHGSESPELLREIKKLHDIGIIKTIKVSNTESLNSISLWEGVADMLLFDTQPPKNNAQQGGHGLTFDWTLLKDKIPPEMSWFLAGGLTAENVGNALAITHAPNIDVSSGVESAPGVKDHKKIEAFIHAAQKVQI